MRGWTASVVAVPALAGCVLAGAGACGEDPRPPPEMDLSVVAAWNYDAESTDQIGYQARVDVIMLDRAVSCVPLPDLRITVNDGDYPIAVGDCDTRVTVTAHALRADYDTVVTVQSAGRQIAGARFVGLFPGVGSLRRGLPADGRVRMGETLALGIPAGWPVGDGRVTAYFSWLDGGPSPWLLNTTVLATANADRTAVELPAPPSTGRADVVLQNLDTPASVSPETCTGFARCSARATTDIIGPVLIEVIP